MNTKNTRRRGAAAGAFTLVELLVVIAIIMLLAGILVPTVQTAIRSAYVARSRTRISELDDGCRQYKQDTKYFPGQLNSSVMPGKTGSEVLAEAMFTKVVPDTPPTYVYPTSNYATYKQSDLLTAGDAAPFSSTHFDGMIADHFPIEKRPILYYPARFGVSGRAQYVETDNSAITGTWSAFTTFIQDGSFGEGDTPFNAGEFLLIAAGADRTFADTDNVQNWGK